MGYRKVDPSPNAYAEGRVREWAYGEPEELRTHDYPLLLSLHNSRGRHPCSQPARWTRRRRRGRPETSGLWAAAAVTDALWPAGDSRTRPLMPLKRGHMAMLVAAGFLDNLVLEADGRRILVKGRTTKEMVLVEDTPQKEVYRERLSTTVTALDLADGEITDIAA